MYCWYNSCIPRYSSGCSACRQRYTLRYGYEAGQSMMFWLLLILHAAAIALAVLSSRVSSAKGVVFLFSISWCCFVGELLFLLITYPVTYIFPTVRDFLKRNSFAFFFSFTTFLMENLIGIKFMFYGDDIQDNVDALSLVICNHHTAFDWMFLWTLFCRLRTSGILKIVLKYELKHVPIFGWIMQASCSKFQHTLNWFLRPPKRKCIHLIN